MIITSLPLISILSGIGPALCNIGCPFIESYDLVLAKPSFNFFYCFLFFNFKAGFGIGIAILAGIGFNGTAPNGFPNRPPAIGAGLAGKPNKPPPTAPGG